MRSISVLRSLKPNDTVVIYAPTSTVGEEVRIFNPKSLDPFVVGVCVGGVKPVMSLSKGSKKKNAHRDYRTFLVK